MYIVQSSRVTFLAVHPHECAYGKCKASVRHFADTLASFQVRLEREIRAVCENPLQVSGSPASFYVVRYQSEATKHQRDF